MFTDDLLRVLYTFIHLCLVISCRAQTTPECVPSCAIELTCRNNAADNLAFRHFTAGEVNGELAECFMSSPPIFYRTNELNNQQQTEQIDITSNEYNINDNTLTVTNVGADDEGLYSCQSDGSSQQRQDISPCVIIDGRAQFDTCGTGSSNNRTQSACSNPYVISETYNCLDTMNVTEGDNVTFDIAITFVDGGACGCNERVTLQRFFRGNNSTPQAFCRDIINDCPPGQSFVDPIVNVTMDDADMYILQVEVSQPRTSGTNCFLKFFNLIVNPAVNETMENSTSMTTAPSTGATDTLMPTPEVIAAGSIAVGIIIPVTAIIMVVFIIVCLYCIHVRSKSPKEEVYSEIETKSYDFVKGQNRGSILCAETPAVDLSPQLESQPIPA